MNQLEDIIVKVRQMFKFDTKLRKVIKLPVSIRIAEENDKLKIKSIIFEDVVTRECVNVTSKSITHLENNVWETVLEYKDFDELLEM